MRPNIVIQAPVFSLSGYGAHARDIVTALFNSKKYNIAIAPSGWGATSTTDKIPPDTLDILMFMVRNEIRTKENLVFVHVGIPPEFKKVGEINIGITAGIESDKLPPQWAESCNIMNGIIVPSVFIRDLFVRNGVKVPVYVAGEGVDTNIYHQGIESKLPLTFQTKFNFLTTGQWSGNDVDGDRKGIGKLIRLFCEEFRESQDVGLVLKVFSFNVSSPDNFFTKQRIDRIKAGKPWPKIHLVHGEFTDEEMAQLYNHPGINAYISVTSGESWHRGVAEAVACDVPVLVTGWSGHMDYLHKDYTTLFDYELGEVPQSSYAPGLFCPGMFWAFPKDDDVRRKMKRCIEHYGVAKERALKMGEIMRENWSKPKTDELLLEAFAKLIPTESKIQMPGVQVEKM